MIEKENIASEILKVEIFGFLILNFYYEPKII